MRRQAGFTLIEILVVLVIVGMLMAALWSGLRIGVRGWHRVATTAQTLEARGTAERVLRLAIRNLAPDNPDCQGDEQHLVCAGMLPDAQTGRMTAVILALGIENQARLVLRWQARPPGLRQSGTEPIRNAVVLTPASSLSLRYFRPGAGWVDRWRAGDGTPDLVRVTIGGGPGAWPAIVEHPIAVFPAAQ
ncbi:type II secretion system protein [Tanticharoenia sakaeratensis]|uniref:General secretion pathway protein J n=1 Tax=Tanticharoenia sakaeratensis NBRC 103193 TaxID=1231623 RepID=A0A0D6MIN8_9PROT|nr:type II secretion system protein [Tanticharoenia sakaeratensis]GAN53148.1 hypothetical protein Tasa_006_012 [Tanticharoenia sakaeratensis NBRC 103193]GBQ24868.1 hypothetical protein AA103193_2881 [Tanticharoenia sakaeratensis NBRC 103193]